MNFVQLKIRRKSKLFKVYYLYSFSFNSLVPFFFKTVNLFLALKAITLSKKIIMYKNSQNFYLRPYLNTKRDLYIFL